MKKKILPVLFTFVFLFLTYPAYGRIYIPIDQPSDKPFPIAISNLVQLDGLRTPLAEDIPGIIKNDLTLSGFFKVISQSAYLDFGTGLSVDSINFAQWTTIEAGAVVKGSIRKIEGKYSIQLKLFDPYTPELLVGKQYVTDKKGVRSVAHRFSDEIMEALTGKRGIFNTKIAYSAVTSRNNKAVYIMDVDGEENYRVTRGNTLDIGPSWSPGGGALTYASYQKGTPEIFTVDLGSGSTKQITKNRNTNITPAYYVDGKTIFYASSLGLSTELFSAGSSGGKTKQITDVGGINIAPRFSKDGGTMVYSSTRAGRLHVYAQPTGGGDARRLTFVGTHNDSPDISPDSSKIVFCGQDTGTFDIFIMNSDGTNIQRLTIDSGSNEHPRWSPDGRYIVFSSTRDGGSAVYMMRADGSNQVKISKGNGSLPDWGPWEK